MDLVPNEKEIMKHENAKKDNLILTNKRLIHQIGEGRNVKISEFLLEKLDSIEYTRSKSYAAFVLGVGVTIAGFLFFFNPYSQFIGFLLVFIGIVSIIIGLVNGSEFVQFKSVTLTISGKGSGIKEFVERVRKEVMS